MRVAVHVMPKPELLDPQGQAVARALPRVGLESVTNVRVGKRIELEVPDGTDPQEIARVAGRLLANPIVEDFTVTLL